MRFHVVSLPHTQVTEAFEVCAFTSKVRKFCKMMHGLGHEVFLYAGEENEAPVTELIPLFTEDERLEACPEGQFVNAKFDRNLPHWKRFNTRATFEIRKRIQPKDFICVIGGASHQPIADNLPEYMTVEFGIGYEGTFAKCRVWESYAWMHACYGAASKGHPSRVDGLWYDAVIPGFVEAEKFPFQGNKYDYFLYVGRLTDRKGYRLAAEVCKKLGKRLIIAGPGEPPDYGEYVGVVGPEQRAELMGRARALFAPTIYLEPFGNVVVEAQMCGTPTITTDWGAFAETNEYGLTGFRCRSFHEFLKATEDVKTLSPFLIHDRAVKNFSLEATAPKYQAYFDRLQTLWGAGWYETDLAGAA